MTREGIKGYYILLTGDAETLADNADETKDNGVTAALKPLNKTSHNKLILSQEDMICFQILENQKPPGLPQGLPIQDYARNSQKASYMA